MRNKLLVIKKSTFLTEKLVDLYNAIPEPTVKKIKDLLCTGCYLATYL